ncbi:MAG: hypothetical protein HQM11_07720 [SAR324 cluster bacterium]|nr:hypothetical protein [SAR324 cluster bacterium]
MYVFRQTKTYAVSNDQFYPIVLPEGVDYALGFEAGLQDNTSWELKANAGSDPYVVVGAFEYRGFDKKPLVSKGETMFYARSIEPSRTLQLIIY